MKKKFLNVSQKTMLNATTIGAIALGSIGTAYGLSELIELGMIHPEEMINAQIIDYKTAVKSVSSLVGVASGIAWNGIAKRKIFKPTQKDQDNKTTYENIEQ